jgi:hypothetical protein
MLFGQGNLQDEPFHSASDFQDSSTFSVYNVISDATGICKNLIKAIVGTEISDGNRNGWIQDINESAPWTTMVILQRFVNLFVKWAQMATDVQIN